MPSLHWIWKDKVINHHLEVPFRLLKKWYSFGDANTGNKIIRWDNLEALKALLPEYEGKVKCIYIDPPYNTGNEGWIYNDNVTDPKIKKWIHEVVGKEGEDLTRHDKWLCMMYPRLKLLHRLLSDEGAIFVSLDDNEQAHLKLMMDEIFGGNNFIANIIWEKNYSPRNDAKYFSASHDFLICFAKKKENWKRNLLARWEKQNKMYKYNDNDGRGVWRPDNVLVKTFSQTWVFWITNPNTWEEFFPPKWSCYRFSKEKSLLLLTENRIYFWKDGKWKPQLKRYLTDVNAWIVPQTLWKHEEVWHNQDGKKELNLIIEGNVFDSPKPYQVIQQVIQIASNPGDIILDSFAGSGTTAHAVLNLNMQDEKKRKFIIVEMEEYAETITAERVKRVIKGYWDKEWTGGGFDFYDLGPALLTSDGLLADVASVDEIRAYICYTETALPLPTTKLVDHTYWLTRTEDRDHYFYYERDRMTVLDRAFLNTLTEKMPYYTVWADQCHLSESVMKKHGITFRKIPRDIRNI